MKLLRPLHKRRSRRRQRAIILNSSELTEHFGLSQQAMAAQSLEQFLKLHQIPYHKDSKGEIWASIVSNDSTDQPPKN